VRHFNIAVKGQHIVHNEPKTSDYGQLVDIDKKDGYRQQNVRQRQKNN